MSQLHELGEDVVNAVNQEDTFVTMHNSNRTQYTGELKKPSRSDSTDFHFRVPFSGQQKNIDCSTIDTAQVELLTKPDLQVTLEDGSMYAKYRQKSAKQKKIWQCSGCKHKFCSAYSLKRHKKISCTETKDQPLKLTESMCPNSDQEPQS